ncbi:MAG TPA: hypothetical protein VLB44_00660 [Kofleriaceae bacterium]|nr:hypothetical protein [Kofleriaceae bacterium]
MRKIVPLLLAAATVVAVIGTAHTQYQLHARQLHAHLVSSGEVLRQHAISISVIEVALDQPVMPDGVVVDVGKRGVG